MSLQELLLSSSSALTCLHDLRTGSLLTSFKGQSSSSSSSHEFLQDTSSSNNAKGKGRATGNDSNERSTSQYRKTVDVLEGKDGVGGLVVAAVPGKSAINVWSFQREAPLQRLLTPIKISCLSISKDGVYLAVGGHDGRLLLWELSTGLLLASFDAHYRAVTCLTWTDDSAALISGSDDAACHVWSLPVMLASPNNPLLPVAPYASLSDHTLAITSLHASFGPFPSLRILTSSLDGTVKLWDLRLPSLPLLSTCSFPPSESVTRCALDPLERSFFAVLQGKNGRGKVCKVDLYRRIRKGDEEVEEWEALGGGGRGDQVRLNGHGGMQEPGENDEGNEEMSSYPGRVYALPPLQSGKSEAISSMHLSTISSHLLLGTTSGSIHVLSLPSLQCIRIIVPTQTASTSSLVAPITFLATLMRPVDLVSRTGGMGSSGKLGEEVLPRSVAGQLGRTLVQSKEMEERVVNVRLTGLQKRSHQGHEEGDDDGDIMEPPFWASLSSKTARSAAGSTAPQINGASSTSANGGSSSLVGLQEENARLREQLARSIAMNERMWEGLVNETLDLGNGQASAKKAALATNGMEVDG